MFRNGHASPTFLGLSHAVDGWNPTKIQNKMISTWQLSKVFFLLEADFGTRKEGWFLGTLRVFFSLLKVLSSWNYVTETFWIDIPYLA